MLLKEIRPNHPLLAVAPISIDALLATSQVPELRAKCQAYSQSLQAVCGQPIAVPDLFRQYAQSRADYIRQATEKFQENMARWTAEQAVKSEVMRKEHARTRAILERQISEVNERKVLARLESLELDRMHVANAERLEAERTAAENRQRQQRIDYYTELGEMVDKQRDEAGEKVKRLRETLLLETVKTERLATELLLGDPVKVAKDDNRNQLVATEELSPPLETPSVLLDANENPTDAAAHNRMVMLGTTFDFQHHDTNTKGSTITVQLSDDNSNPLMKPEPQTPSTAHLEMLQNRAKVMNQQYNLFAPIDASARPRAVTTDPDQMTDLQRNRKKILNEEYGITVVGKLPEPVRKQPELQLDLVAGYNEEELPFATPMSTSSDTPNKHIRELLAAAELKSPLKLDIPQPQSTTAINEDTASDHSVSSVYETARSGPTHGNPFEFPTSPDPPEPASKYIQTFAQLASKHRLWQTPAAPALDQQVLAELASPNISSITHCLRLSFALPLKAHLKILNNEILKVFLLDFNLIAQFKSLRNYFFMMDGEFASHICDGLFAKIETDVAPAKLLQFSFLHSLLDNALGSSVFGNDPNGQHLSFFISHMPERFQHDSPDVLRMLKLCYTVQWPLNLVLSHQAMAHYELIFGHLLKLRRIRFVLDRTSQMLKEVAKSAGPRLLRSPQYRHVQQVRHRLLHFISSLQNHVTTNALQASWRWFKKELERAESVEDVSRMHERYLQRVLFLCMLDSSKSKTFNANLDKIWVISLRFYQ